MAPPKSDAFVTLGWQVAHWIETLLVHGPGDVEGEPINLDAEFMAALVRAYRVDPQSGRRLIRRYTFSRPKGRAKSEFAGMIGSAELLGPVRFDHFAKKGETSWWGYEFEVGEPVGIPVRSPFLRCLATEEGQGANTFANIRVMLERGAIADAIPGIDAGETRIFTHGLSGSDARGECRAATAAAASKDGGKESWACADETHLYTTPQLKSMYETVDRNARKRLAAQPWMLNTTTAYEVGADSVAEQLMADRSTAHFIDHVQGATALDVLPIKDLDPTKKKSKAWSTMRQALERAYGEFAQHMDLDAIIEEEFASKRKDPSLSARYFLNIPQVQVADRGWLREHPGKWAACESDLPLVDGAETWAGVDSALNRDSAAVALVQRHEGRLVVRCTIWEPRGGIIPYDEMKAHLRAASYQYKLVGCAYDSRYWMESAIELQDEGLPMVEVPQSLERMTPMCGRAQEAVLSGELAHDGGEELTRHVLNAAKKINERGFTFSKVKSGAKIDGWIAVVLAVGEADVPAEPESVYETRRSFSWLS